LHLAYVYEEAAGWAKKQREAAISN
jgi:hypothetical protein